IGLEVNAAEGVGFITMSENGVQAGHGCGCYTQLKTAATNGSGPRRNRAMKTAAAVLVELDRPLELWDLEIPVLRPGQVLVQLAYSGVCHTQVLEARGKRGPDRFLPHCLGHEGSGWVRECGPGVTRVRPGEPVILSWIKAPGIDVAGSVYTCGGRSVNAGAVTTFQDWAVVSENRLTPLPGDFPLREAALIGCAVPTGVGVVLHTARLQAGEGVAVFGVGGIGLCAVAAARLAGCWPIVAIDVRAAKLRLATQLGATHTVDVTVTDPVAFVQQLCPGGIDCSIECSGRPSVMRQALAAVRPRGGTAVVVGNAPAGDLLEVDPRELNQGKRLLGSWGGESVPDRDFPRYCRLMAAGRLDLSPLLTREYTLDQINQALDDLEEGRAFRPLIRFPPA
ncbi:MAG: zinc-binding dehydrogenase, partial [Gemmataceae bacterium]|nr:zinc-binding dehydrogenase [Gemmataceae bacterium]